MSNVPLRFEMNAANFPSGEIAGLLLAPSKLVSRVNWALESGFWAVGRGRLATIHANNPAASNATRVHGNQARRSGATIAEVVARAPLESVSRLRRFRSVRISEACWYLKLRSFSKHLLIISSNFGGRSGSSRVGATGVRFRIASNIVGELFPRKGCCPVAISYKTDPNENKSVRASSSLARASSRDI